MPSPEDKVGDAELTIGDSTIMLADEHPDMGARACARSAAPRSRFSCARVKASVAVGAKVLPVADQFYGDRMGTIEVRLAIIGTCPRTRMTCPPPRWSAARRPRTRRARQPGARPAAPS
jgi:hypothetical protein